MYNSGSFQMIEIPLSSLTNISHISSELKRPHALDEHYVVCYTGQVIKQLIGQYDYSNTKSDKNIASESI